MKKIIILLAFSLSLFGVDQSQNSNSNQDYKEDKTVGYNKSINVNNSKDTSEDNSKTKESSYTVSHDLAKIEQTSALIVLMALEKTGIQPFASCKVLTRPSLPRDFDLSCDNGDGRVNEGRCNFLNNAANSNFSIDKVTYLDEELKGYFACIGLYGALIAQDMKRDKFSAILTDKELLKTFRFFAYDLENSDCRLNGSTTHIICGASTLNISPKPDLIYSNISLYSDNTFYGYSSSVSRNKSKRQANSFSFSKSKKKSKSNAMAKSINTNKSTSTAISKAASSNLSLSKFLPTD